MAAPLQSVSGPPAQLGRHEVLALLGRGMMGVVYKAWHPLLGRLAALKTLRPDLPLPEDERQLVEQRFLRLEVEVDGVRQGA